jgi:hypothetical protein
MGNCNLLVDDEVDVEDVFGSETFSVDFFCQENFSSVGDSQEVVDDVSYKQCRIELYDFYFDSNEFFSLKD